MRKGKIADSSVMKSCQRGIYDNILWLKRITDDRPIVQFNADGKTFVCSHAQHRAIFGQRVHLDAASGQFHQKQVKVDRLRTMPGKRKPIIVTADCMVCKVKQFTVLYLAVHFSNLLTIWLVRVQTYPTNQDCGNYNEKLWNQQYAFSIFVCKPKYISIKRKFMVKMTIKMILSILVDRFNSRKSSPKRRPSERHNNSFV